MKSLPSICARTLCTVALATAVALPVCAEDGTADAGTIPALENTINQLDATFFGAFNRCDTAAMGRVIAADFEFYHDKGGLTRGREPMLAMEEERCSRTDTTLRREVVDGSLAVFPLERYGAVQQGMHRFYLSEGEGPERLIEIARFMHVWRQTGDGWEITRAISYDHREP